METQVKANGAVIGSVYKDGVGRWVSRLNGSAWGNYHETKAEAVAAVKGGKLTPRW